MLLITKSWRCQSHSGCTIGDTPTTPPFSHLKLISFIIILSLKLQAAFWVGVLPFQQTTEEQIHLELYLLTARLQVAAKADISSELQPLDGRRGGIASAELNGFLVKVKQKLLPGLWKNHIFCLWRSRVHAFHPFLQKPSKPSTTRPG